MEKKDISLCRVFHCGQQMDLIDFVLLLKILKKENNEDSAVDLEFHLVLTVPKEYFEIIKVEDVFIYLNDVAHPPILKVQSSDDPEQQLILHLHDTCTKHGTLRYTHIRLNQ